MYREEGTPTSFAERSTEVSIGRDREEETVGFI